MQLTWTVPEGTVESFTVFRDGEQLTSVPATQTTFVDDTVLPLQRSTYEIEAVGGGITSERATVQVRMPAAPLGEARLDGSFLVKAKATSHFGFTTFPGGFTTRWRFRATCPEGPCDTAWNDVNVHDFSTVLALSANGYAGSDQADFGKCGSTFVTTTWTLDVTVVKAATIKDAWRATKIDGTIEQRSAAQLGCVATGADYRFTGTIER